MGELFRDSGLAGKTALVTGGGRGIGRAIALALVGEGARVHVFYRSGEEAADETRRLAAERGGPLEAHRVDVTDADAIDAAVETVGGDARRIDVLVNNAGITRDGLLAALDDEDVRSVLDVNVGGAFRVTRAALRFMIPHRSGSIVNVSSVAAAKGGRGQTGYAASKGAIEAATRALAVELASKRIRVNAVAPGVIETEMSREVRERAGEEVLSRILLGRYGAPSDVAAAVVFLVSRHADYVNGEVLRVDGGFKME